MKGSEVERTGFHPPHGGPRCSTAVSARLRERRFAMGYVSLPQPEAMQRLAARATAVGLQHEDEHPALARAHAMEVVVTECPLALEKDALLLGGEDPFLFNVLLPSLQADRYEAYLQHADPDARTALLRQHRAIFCAPCFEGHITPGLETILGLGTTGLRQRCHDAMLKLPRGTKRGVRQRQWYAAALLSCANIERYAARLSAEARRLSQETDDAEWAEQLREAASALEWVPLHPARTFQEALQAYWLVYILVTIEMGGCMPGGGLGLGRPDQYLYPFYAADRAAGRLTRARALELLEVFLLNFRHVDYYTPHQVFTPGSQASIGGVTPTGLDASNELTDLIMDASLRIHMPTPYISVRLHRDAPEPVWQAAADYVIGGLGFSIVNDHVLIPAFLKHGRSLADARDYICSCCYEFTIPGREAFNPGGCFINLPLILEMTLNRGCSLLTGKRLGPTGPSPSVFTSFGELMAEFERQVDGVLARAVRLVNRADAARMRLRQMPMMSLFIDPCIESGTDVCSGGARYNLTGMIVSGLPNVVNSLAAIRHCVFENGLYTMAELANALRHDFAGSEDLRQALHRAPKWGNGLAETDALARRISDHLYGHMCMVQNPRGGRWQLALYSFVANMDLGKATAASADGRRACTPLTRNLNPSWGTDRRGPTAVLASLSTINFTQFPNGGTLDLRFDPAPLLSVSGRRRFKDFLKGFVELGVMQMQISMVDTETLLQARQHPEQWPQLMVKVAGYSARFIDLSEAEKDEIIGRSQQRLA